MDEQLARQLTRQLKILNIWISIVGTVIIAAIILCIILLFKVVTFVQDTSDQVSNIREKTQESLNVKTQICDSNSLSRLLEDRTTFCER